MAGWPGSLIELDPKLEGMMREWEQDLVIGVYP